MCMSYEKCLIIGFETMEHYANDGVYIKLKQKHFNICNVTRNHILPQNKGKSRYLDILTVLTKIHKQLISPLINFID